MLLEKPLKASQELIQELNRVAILKMVRDKGPISRADLARETGLSPSAITSLTGALIKRSLIHEKELGASRKGRRPVLLEFNYGGGILIGVEIEMDKAAIAITDLGGSLLNIQRCPFDDHSPDTVLKKTASLLRNVLEEVRASKVSLYGIGVSFPGVVDVQTGACLFWADPGWGYIEVKKSLEADFGLPVLVEEDVRAEALGEFWFGLAQEVSNLVCIRVDNGVGAGVIIDGHLYRGTHNTAGEIGHIMVDPDGARCTCGHVGCLQTKISAPAIVRQAIEGLQHHPESALSDIPPGEITPRKIFDLKESDPLCQEIFEEVSIFLGIGVATVVNVYDPEMVILTGSVVEQADELLERVKVTETRQVLRTAADKVDIQKSGFGENAGVVGAAALVFHNLISGPRFG
jgi:glucokinase-like ROK family protein